MEVGQGCEEVQDLVDGAEEMKMVGFVQRGVKQCCTKIRVM